MIQLTHDTIEMYRSTLLRTPETREVLKDILNDLRFFEQRLETDEDRILQNAGRVLMAKLGIMLPGQIDEYMNALATIAPPYPKEN